MEMKGTMGQARVIVRMGELLVAVLLGMVLCMMGASQAHAATVSESEPNDAGGKADAVKIGDTVKGKLAKSGSEDIADDDWDCYKFTVSGPCNVKLTLANDKVKKRASVSVMYSTDKNGYMDASGGGWTTANFSANSKKADSTILKIKKKGTYLFVIHPTYFLSSHIYPDKNHPYHFKLTYDSPDSVKLTAATGGAKSFTAKWAKSSGATKYQLRYSTASTMKNAKTVNVAKSNTSTTVKNLSAKKKYYVQVRVVQTIGGKTYYSKWSASKAVTTKAAVSAKSIAAGRIAA